MLLLFGMWPYTILLVSTGMILSYVAYKKAGGKENPALYENEDIFELIKYGVKSDQVKIGFHSLRNQSKVLEIFSSLGCQIKNNDVRNEICRLIINKRDAFLACQELIVIQTYIDGKEFICNGLGEKKNAGFVLEAEIILNANGSTDAYKKVLVSLMGFQTNDS